MATQTVPKPIEYHAEQDGYDVVRGTKQQLQALGIGVGMAFPASGPAEQEYRKHVFDSLKDLVDFTKTSAS